MPTSPTPLDAKILAKLAGLRRRIRAYVWLQGLAVAAVLLGLAFWVSLAVDYWQEPPSAVRVAMLVCVGVALLAVLFRLILRRAFVRLSDRSMALLLERRFDRFHDSLLTAVELSELNDPRVEFNPAMLAEARRQAVDQTAGVDVKQVFNRGPLVRAVAVAAALAASIVVFALAAPDALAIWTRRSFLLSDELWPRKTRLEVEGFADGKIKVARGSNVQLVVKADTTMVVPDVVQVRFRTDEGGRFRENMARDGVADPKRDPFQLFSHTFGSVLNPLWVDVVGGDDRLRDLRIEVVDSPAIAGMTLFCEYPAYMVREDLDLYTPRELPVTEFMQLPVGSRVTVRAKTNKDLIRVQVDYQLDKNRAETHTIDVPQQTGGDRRAFEFTLEELNEDKTLLFSLLDADGIKNREPARLAIGARPDEPPQATVRLRGIGTAITPSARLPIVGEITDDYGLAQAWFEYTIDEGTAERRPLTKSPNRAASLKFDEQEYGEAFDVRDELQLQPKQKLLIAVKAADTYDLEAAPHTGSSQKFLLDIVTPAQFRLLLEARELNLRRRFESIIDEVTQTRESLAAIVIGPQGDTKTPADGKGGEKAAEKPAVADEETPVSVASLHVQRAVQNCRKNSYETLGVATSFDDIRAELINNRLDTEELKARLKERISDPLKQIVSNRFPELERRLETLLPQLSDAQAGAKSLVLAQQQADLVLVEMQQVLSQMLELETFNEAIALLRSIIESQEQINEKTKKQRKTSILDE